MKSNKMTPQSSIHDGKFEDWIGPEFYYKEPQNTGTLFVHVSVYQSGTWIPFITKKYGLNVFQATLQCLIKCYGDLWTPLFYEKYLY